MKKRPATQWVKPGMKACVKHLRCEDDLRHALPSQNFGKTRCDVTVFAR